MKRYHTKKELLKKAKNYGWSYSNYPLFKGIYIIPRKELHDSGYKMMYIIGHTDYNEKIKDYEYYLLGDYSDVVNIEPVFDEMIKGNYNMCDLHLDIDRKGIIHLWTRTKYKAIKVEHTFVSSCGFVVVDRK